MLSTNIAIFDPLARSLRAHPPFAVRLGQADRQTAAAPGLSPMLDALYPAAGIAALRYFADCGAAPTGQVIAADPAYLRAEARGVRVMALGELALDEAQTREISAELAPIFAEHEMHLCTPNPVRWYLQSLRSRPELLSTEPALLLGAQLLGALPSNVFWQRLFNDVQIALAQMPSQQLRAASGLLPVNGLWFWGAGALAATPKYVVRCESTDPTLRGLVLATQNFPLIATVPKLPLMNVYDLRSQPERWRELAHGTQCWFTSGERFVLKRGQPLKFWRKPVSAP